MIWTQFNDAHSGGGQKLEWASIYIEAPAEEAKIIFQNAFGRNPNRVTCTCCGEDYSINAHESLAQLSGYERGCANLVTPRLPNGLYDNNNPVIKACLWQEKDEVPPKGFAVECHYRQDSYTTLAEYVKKPNVKVISAKEIKPEWREGELQEEGYVWR